MLRRSLKKLTNKINRNFGAQKIISIEEAVSHVKEGNTVLAGGFGICGVPETLLEEVVNQNIGDLTVVSSNAGIDDYGIGVLVQKGLMKRMVGSYLGGNDYYERKYLNGELELEFIPQGTLAEKLRSGGKGIPAFWTRTGVDTLVEKGGLPIKFKKGGSGDIEIGSEPKRTDTFNGEIHFSILFFFDLFLQKNLDLCFDKLLKLFYLTFFREEILNGRNYSR